MNWRRPRVLLVGDIGGASTFHVGDEAMFAADLELVRRLLPRARCSAVSADPAFTASTFGIDVVERPSLRALHGSEREGRPPALAAAADADLLVVTGGGNLNSSFPTLIMERLALARATSDSGGTVVVLGQTLGPALTRGDAERVAELLGRAGFVGLRDEASMAVAVSLGIDEVKIVEQVDDAWALEASTPSTVSFASDHPLIAVTLHPEPRVVSPRAIGALADQLTDLAEATGFELLLIPHCRAAEGPAGSSDETVAAGLAEQLEVRSVGVTLLPVLPPSEVVGATLAADLVITTRYHPLVFAHRGAVPALALWADPYIRAKQVGALAHARLEGWALPLDEAIGGRLVPAAIEMHDRRKEIRTWLTSVQPSLDARMAARDEQLAAFLRNTGFAAAHTKAAASAAMPALGAAPTPAGGWDTAAAPALRPVPDPLLDEFVAMRDYARSLEIERDATRSQAAADENQQVRAESARTETVLDRLRLEVDANRLALVAHVSSPQIDSDVRLRVYAPDLAAGVDASATPMLPIVTLVAARLGTDLVVDAPIDEIALEGAHRAAGLLADWWGWRPPRISVATTMAARSPAPGVGLWFSRGVDSTYTLLSARAGDPVVDGLPIDITHLLGLDWIDPPLVVRSTADVWSDTEAVASSLGLPLLRFTTDVRRVLDPVMSWEHSHGAVLAALALLVGPALRAVLISGTSSPGPFGSHPRLDPLWSASGTRIVHAAAEVPRSEKVARVAQDPWAMSHLKVCWKADTARNCGRCAKCLATMTMFRVMAGLDHVDRFDAPLTGNAVLELLESPEPLALVPSTVDDVLRILPAENVELRTAWEAVRDRLQREATSALE